MNSKPNFPLGELLIEKGVITKEQLDTALAKQKETGDLLGSVLLELGFVNEEAVFLPILAGSQGFEYINLKEIEISQEAVNCVPAKFASYYRIMPFSLDEGILSFATNRPGDLHIYDEVGLVVNYKLKPVMATEKDILDELTEQNKSVLSTLMQDFNCFCVQAIFYRHNVIITPKYRGLFVSGSQVSKISL